ncbi:MAG: glutamine amidotransferase [Verrucomicrobiota bacterium]
MMFAALTFSGRDWLWPTAVFFGVVVFVLLWSYRAGPAGAVRWVCAVLKLLAIAALALCLLEPLWTRQRSKPGANLFVIIADNSAGLQIKDQGETKSRGEQLQTLLNPEAANWQEVLADNFELRRFTFDSRLNTTRDFSGLDFSGRASGIGAALRGVAERFQGRPVAGVLLLTDGNATDIHEAWPEMPGLPPVYPVMIGRAGGAQDVSVGQVNVSQTAFEDAPVSAQANVGVVGLSGEEVTAQLLDAAGKRIETQTLRVRKDSDSLAFRFQWRPENPGLSFYRLRVGLSDEIQTTNTISAREVTLANNMRVISVDRGRGPYRILYVGGRPNWEFKFFNRAEQEDDQVQLVALIRVALREPKFDFRGRAGETSNPLYRGFGNQSAEDVERYDQPVLTRLNTRDEFELRNGFPRRAEELFGYHAVIIDDIEAAFFAPDQAALLQKFVSERGGGFLMLGGMESFRQGQYQRTPIGDLLPVYLDRAGETKPPESLKLNLSREGWLQAWARLRDNESDERARLQAMPAFEVFNPAREVKPGASVIATAADAAGKEYPALVTQRFGRGQSAALMVGDMWRWGMQSPEARRDMEKSWRQLVRWLISDVPKRVDLAVESVAEEASGAVKLQVRVRDEKFQPLDDATVLLEIEPVLSDVGNTNPSTVRLRAEASSSEAGVYETTFVPRHTGGYRATARVVNPMGVEMGQAEAGWSSDLLAQEFKSLQPNPELLAAIARRTGGEVIAAGKLDAFVKELPNRRAPVMETWTMPAWHTPGWFGFALACLAGEWGLRRWKGAP